MRRLVLFMLTSLDGYFEGANHDITWHHADEEFNEFAVQQTSEFGMLLFGKITYELMAAYWPTEAAKKDDPIVAGLMNKLPKVVFSTSLAEAAWENSRLVKDDFVEEVRRLKSVAGKDMAIFGSSDLAVSFIEHELIDEFCIMVNPVVLGNGKSLFVGLQKKLELKLKKTKTFKSGNILLYYVPIRRKAPRVEAKA